MSLPSSSSFMHFIFSFALMFSPTSCLVCLIMAVHTSRLIMYYKLYITTVYIICPYLRDVQHIMCCGFFLHLVYPMLPCYSGLSIFDCPIRVSLTFIFVMCLVYLMLIVTLNFPFFIAIRFSLTFIFVLRLVYLILPVTINDFQAI